MLLQGKCAVVYGAAGSIGGAVAKAFSAEGARVALTGRTLEPLERVMSEINGAGGLAECAVFDAYDLDSVESHLERYVAENERVDISFNAVGLGYVIAEPLTDEAVDDFAGSVANAMRTQFITATAAARHMARAGSGVILTIIASPARAPMPNQGSLGVVGAAIEGLFRQLAMDVGPSGVRVLCLCSAGSPDAPGVDHAMTLAAESAGLSREVFEAQYAERSALKRLPRLTEIGEVAALVASDRASALTATLANATCGQFVN